MFKALRSFGCHLLLGNAASKLIILLGSLVLLNAITENEIRPRFLKNQIKSISLKSTLSTAVQNLQFDHWSQAKEFNKKEINEEIRKKIKRKNGKKYRKKIERRKDAFFRFKRFFSNNDETSINQLNSIKSNGNNSNYHTLLIKNTTDQPLNQFDHNLSTKLSNDQLNQLIITTLPSNLTIIDHSIKITSTTSKPQTNIGYKYNYYDRNEMRKQNRLNKDSSNLSWNGLLKLIFLLLICTLGTTGNIFIISSIMVVESFQMQGNIYIVSLALSQLLITIIAIPGSCIEIMRNDNYPFTCHIQWLLTQFTFIIILLSFMLISIENCSALRSRSLINHNLFCSKFRIIILVLFSWSLAGFIVYTQNRNELAPSLCQHELTNNIWPIYHLTIIISVILLTLITMICFLKAAFQVKKINIQFENNPLENNWQLVIADGELVKANIIVYLYTFFMWLPLCILASLSVYRRVNMDSINSSWWIAMFNSCSIPFVYAFFNQSFSKTFMKLFFYCCCKTHMQFSETKTAMNLNYLNYQRRNVSTTAGTNNMELRVHMIHMNPRRDDSLSTGYTSTHGSHYNVKNQKYGGMVAGRHTSTGFGFGEFELAHSNTSTSYHQPNKWNSRIDSSDSGSANYSGSLSNRYGSRGHSNLNYSTHLIDAKDYSSMYDYGHTKHRFYSPNNQKYFI